VWQLVVLQLISKSVSKVLGWSLQALLLKLQMEVKNGKD